MHGERAWYQRGCRCLLCRAANARYEAGRRKARAHGEHLPMEKAPGYVTSRQIQSLRAEGFTWARLSRVLGLHRNTLRKHTTSTMTTQRTVTRIARFWDMQQV